MSTVYESAFAVALDDEPASLASARTLSHDTVIANTGLSRRSGVSWTYWSTDSAVAELQAEGIGASPELAALCASLPGRTLVMATVEIDV